jgi:hypothetical protein
VEENSVCGFLGLLLKFLYNKLLGTSGKSYLSLTVKWSQHIGFEGPLSLVLIEFSWLVLDGQERHGLS